jgi:hypothetical protein
MTRVPLTVACPEADRDDATHLGVCLGWSEGYTPDEWWGAFSSQYQDAQGNLYRVMSVPVAPGFVAKAAPNVPVERPEADTENDVNLTGARRAQDKLAIWMPTDPPQPVPAADPSRIVAVVGLRGVEALAAMGLDAVEIADPGRAARR